MAIATRSFPYFAAISGIPAAAQMAARALAPFGAGLAVAALASTLAMGMFAVSARPLKLAGEGLDENELTAG